NQPQAAILSTESIRRRPVVVGDTIGIRPIMNLTMSFDHRIIDGLAASRFLNDVQAGIEDWTPEKITLWRDPAHVRPRGPRWREGTGRWRRAPRRGPCGRSGRSCLIALPALHRCESGARAGATPCNRRRPCPATRTPPWLRETPWRWVTACRNPSLPAPRERGPAPAPIVSSGARHPPRADPSPRRIR